MEKLFKIVKDNKKSLRMKSTPIDFPYDQKYIDLGKKMVEYLKISQDDELAEKYNIRSGVGLAAPQIGVNKQLIAIYINQPQGEGKDPIIYEMALINPKIVSESVQMCALEGGEGCLSVDKEHNGYVYRHNKIVVEAFDIIKNEHVKFQASGYLAIVLQHEIDHLSGVLFYDRINKLAPFKKDEGLIII